MSFSLRKVVWNDWPALATAIAVPMTWMVQFGFLYLQRKATPLPLWLPACLSVVLIALLSWRIGRVRWLFVHGVPVVGAVTGLWIAKDRGRLEFVFEVGGERVRSWMPIHKTKAVLSLSQGDRVDLLVDPGRPTRAIVKRLFEK